VSLPKFRRLGDTGPIIISHEEITCCYLVKSKSVLVTDISAKITAKMIRYLGEPNSSQASSAENVIRQWNCGGAPAQEAAGHPRRCRMKLEQVKLIQTYVEYVCPLSPMQAIIAIFNV